MNRKFIARKQLKYDRRGTIKLKITTKYINK